MRKFFNTLATTLTLLFLGAPVAYAADSPKQTCSEKAGCKNEAAAGIGTGVSACWVTFVAPEGAKGMKLQLFDNDHNGLLRNKKGEIAVRGSEMETRVSVDCGVILRAVEMKNCVYMLPNPDGTPHVRNGDAKEERYRFFLQYAYHEGGIDVQL